MTGIEDSENIEIKGSLTGRISPANPEPQWIDNPFFAGGEETHIIEVPRSRVDLVIVALALGHRWPIDQTMQAMGVEWEFDYAGLPPEEQAQSARLTRCYEIVARAFAVLEDVAPVAETEALPLPETLVHGIWSSPKTRDNPIEHAWVVLSDGRIWEPITRGIYDSTTFFEFTQGFQKRTYNVVAVLNNMVGSGHFGPWDPS